jgi:hypothetical protein
VFIAEVEPQPRLKSSSLTSRGCQTMARGLGVVLVQEPEKEAEVRLHRRQHLRRREFVIEDTLMLGDALKLANNGW